MYTYITKKVRWLLIHSILIIKMQINALWRIMTLCQTELKRRSFEYAYETISISDCGNEKTRYVWYGLMSEIGSEIELGQLMHAGDVLWSWLEPWLRSWLAELHSWRGLQWGGSHSCGVFCVSVVKTDLRTASDVMNEAVRAKSATSALIMPLTHLVHASTALTLSPSLSCSSSH